jgi:hypothetical protein
LCFQGDIMLVEIDFESRKVRNFYCTNLLPRNRMYMEGGMF